MTVSIKYAVELQANVPGADEVGPIAELTVLDVDVFMVLLEEQLLMVDVMITVVKTVDVT